MAMVWHDLLFIHYRVDAALLRPLIPAALSIETFDGSAWLAIVPFRMSGIRPRRLPAAPWVSNFAELNVRTYVRLDDRPGVWFFSLDAANPLAVQVARRTYHLNYCDAQMRCDRAADGTIAYTSRRTHRAMKRAEFIATYRPAGPSFQAQPGTAEHFLTERYCLYSASADGRLFRGEIAHAPWSLQAAEAKIRRNTMATPLGVTLPEPSMLHYADRLDVIAWQPERVGGTYDSA